MKSLKPSRRARFSPVQIGTLEAGHQALPRVRVLHAQRILEPERLDRFHCLGELDRGAQIVLPVAVDHHVVVPADRLAAVLESLPHLDQLFGGELLIAEVAPVVGLGIGMREAELVRGEAAGVRVDLLRPLAARRLVQHVARRCMIVDAHPVAELAAEQRAGGHRRELCPRDPTAPSRCRWPPAESCARSHPCAFR